ncbi:hypothetical protein SeMB42_g00854, partial [Synchytrium endobioticum]
MAQPPSSSSTSPCGDDSPGLVTVGKGEEATCNSGRSSKCHGRLSSVRPVADQIGALLTKQDAQRRSSESTRQQEPTLPINQTKRNMLSMFSHHQQSHEQVYNYSSAIPEEHKACLTHEIL